MGHVSVEDIPVERIMIMPTVLSVIFGRPLPLHGLTDVSHGPHLKLLMTLSKVDVILYSSPTPPLAYRTTQFERKTILKGP